MCAGASTPSVPGRCFNDDIVDGGIHECLERAPFGGEVGELIEEMSEGALDRAVGLGLVWDEIRNAGGDVTEVTPVELRQRLPVPLGDEAEQAVDIDVLETAANGSQSLDPVKRRGVREELRRKILRELSWHHRTAAAHRRAAVRPGLAPGSPAGPCEAEPAIVPAPVHDHLKAGSPYVVRAERRDQLLG
jgi:hypothetical protein